MKPALIPPEYTVFLSELKGSIQSARLNASRAVNRELVLLYWDIGRGILEKQKTLGWGESVIDRLSDDLKQFFPNTAGFSPRNLRDMRRFYLAYVDPEIWRQAVAKLNRGAQSRVDLPAEEILSQSVPQLLALIPWGHQLLLLNKLDDPASRLQNSLPMWCGKSSPQGPNEKPERIDPLGLIEKRRKGAALFFRRPGIKVFNPFKEPGIENGSFSGAAANC